LEEHPDGELEAADDEPGTQLLPIFPLPDVWLSPMTLMPLNIFEPRYRRMIEDLLDGPGRLVMGTVVEGQDGQDVPEIYPIAGLGEIGRHEKLDDGRFMIWVMGLKRVRVVEVESDHPYRMVEAESISESQPEGKEKEMLIVSLRRALDEVLAEMPEKQRPPEKVLKNLTVGSLADILCSRLELERARIQEIFATLDTAERARMVLGEYAQMKLSEGEESEGNESKDSESEDDTPS